MEDGTQLLQKLDKMPLLESISITENETTHTNKQTKQKRNWLSVELMFSEIQPYELI